MGNTANIALPYPENTDPLANMAAAVQALANAIDAAHPAKWKRGQTVQNVDASGDITINHGLAAAPTAVIVTQGRLDANWNAAAHTFTATTFKVRLRTANLGSVVAAGQSATVNWAAFS